ncbi:uncharacterized protein LOC123327441 [Drosophila simulans]|uniref:uncharacterized protein LOC123327441 n=1 Tax=Drosophila simulans TaxID=7240 RepID=UPI001D101EF8|nr:uncharacterized protein LOC123327441 [Drosophila simulans]
MSVDDRSAYIKRKQLCLNCFAKGHQLPSRCSKLFRHGLKSYPSWIINISHLGTNFKARALIDSGSEATFITERLFNLIRLPFQVVQAQFSGLNQTVAAQSKKLCSFTIRSPTRPALQLETMAYVLPQLAGNLPSYPIPQNFLRDLPDFPLADPKFYESAQIDVLIGADILPSVLLSGAKTNICGSLLGQETIFGWVLTGPVSASAQSRISSFSTQISHAYDNSLDKLLTKFWEVENIPTKLVKESDSMCEKNFLQTTTRNECGKYVVTLPFRDPEHIGSGLGHSRSFALAQFLKNEQRLKRDEALKARYDSVIQEYLDLKHMRQVVRVLQQLAADVQLSHPKASNVIRNFMYVDDVLAGADSTEEAQLMVQELRDVLNSAGFPLRKWTSNQKEVLAAIQSNHLLNTDFLEIDAKSTAKTLGIRWRATSDEFFFVPPELANETSFTKRQVLSQIAKLFDPAGWLAPFIVRAKIFMQEIWLQELGWDENIPNELFLRWLNFLQNYSVLEQIRIPRWLSFRPDFKVEHHGFCDASQKAYGAAIYVRVEVGSTIMVQLLTAKTRVAPVETVTLPRLELCGALLLSEMDAAIIPQMPTINSELYCWTDFTIVLAWLSKPACQWITFVANRVTKIAQATKTEN